ncbi:aspartate 1-decarboxylase [bacterium]|nr:aspartate 1-decarboxylase [bacterium]
MKVTMLKSKLHRACITDANVEYEGSMGVSVELMEAVGLMPWEKILVANLNNGNRLETYVIPVEEPGQIILNGAAAHKGKAGERIIVMSFCELEHSEAMTHMPSKVVLNERNEIVERLVMPVRQPESLRPGC